MIIIQITYFYKVLDFVSFRKQDSLVIAPRRYYMLI